jgi:hypothetical protein
MATIYRYDRLGFFQSELAYSAGSQKHNEFSSMAAPASEDAPR